MYEIYSTKYAETMAALKNAEINTPTFPSCKDPSAFHAVPSVAMFPMTNPHAEIDVRAGRGHLRTLQATVFPVAAAGATIGSPLTAGQREIEDDLRLFEDLDLNGGRLGRGKVYEGFIASTNS